MYSVYELASPVSQHDTRRRQIFAMDVAKDSPLSMSIHAAAFADLLFTRQKVTDVGRSDIMMNFKRLF
jgi:hypothetical protein